MATDATPSGQTPANPDAPAAPVADPVADPSAAKPVAAPAVDPAKPADPPAAAKPAVPEKYDFTGVKLPEGMALDQPLVDAMSPLFKEAGLTQETASKLVDAHAKYLHATETKREADFKEFMKTSVTEHQAALKKAWGANFDTNLATAQKGLASFSRVEDGVFTAEESAAFKALLDETGLGQHRLFLKIFHRIGKTVSEDVPPNGGPSTTRKSNAEVFYGAPN